MPAMSIPPEAEQFRGTRWEILRAYEDEDIALLRLHKWFDGNATAAGNFLGFSTEGRSPVSNKWAKLGLVCLGKEKPRRGGNTGWPERPLEDLDKEYTALSGEQENVLLYEWDVAASTLKVKLIPICDVHCCHIACAWDRFKILCKWIHEHPLSRWFLGGDNLDVRTKNSPGASSEQFCSIEQGIDLMEMALTPIADQGITIFEGNHEERLRREDMEYSPSRQLANRLNLPYSGICAHILHRLGEQEYTHFHHHGIGSSRTPGGKLNTLLAIADTVTDELVTVGHLHYEIAAKMLSRHPNKETLKVENQVRRPVLCPSFLQYRGYPAARAFKPSSLGVSTIELGVAKHDIRVIE